MKAPILTSILGALLVILGACNSNPVGINATGIAYEIVVVADQAIWNDAVGSVVKDELLMDVPGLPQSEPSMRITYVPPAEFNGMMTYVRNILIVNIDESQYTKVSVKMEKDRWATGQIVIYLSAPNGSMLTEYLNDNKGILVDYYSKVEMNRMAGVLESTYSTLVMEKLKSKFDVMLNAPSDIGSSYKDTVDFFWASNNANTGRMDLVVYTFPYTDSKTFSLEYLLVMRDSILGANIPGSFPGSYMATDSSTVTYTPITLFEKYCGVLRGLWQMEGDMMGGPFVSYTRLDEINNRIVVAEGFVYAPETTKKNYMRRLEAALHTLRLPGEFNLPLEGPEIKE